MNETGDLAASWLRRSIRAEQFTTPTLNDIRERSLAPQSFMGLSVAGALSLPVTMLSTAAPEAAPVRDVPREQVSAAVAPSADVTDLTLFEDAADPNTKRYLPRYRVAQPMVAGRRQYTVKLAEDEAGWMLSVNFEKFVAPELGDTVRGLQEVDHALSITLTYDLLLGGAAGSRKELVFNQISVVEGGVRAVLRGTQLTERDMLYTALTERAHAATLLVRRALTVAVPLPAGLSGDGPTRPILQLGTDGIPRTIVESPGAPLRPILQLGAPTTPVRVVPDPTTLASGIFREELHVLDILVEPSPFVFLPALHGYIFESGTGSGGSFTPTWRQVRWNDHFVSYYQDRGDPARFFYLPDSFKLARRDQPPFHPLVSVRFESADGEIESMRASLELMAVPYVDTERLAAASVELQRFVAAGQTIQFEPLLSDKLLLKLALPGEGNASTTFAERSGALLDLRIGIRDVLTLSVNAFQRIYEALFSPQSQLLKGQVEVRLGSQPAEVIPVVTHMHDMVGSLFTVETMTDATTSEVKVILTNAVESPIRIERLTAELVYEGARTLATVQVVGASLPLQLAPSENVVLLLKPEVPQVGQPARPVFNLDGVVVLPDREAIWSAILDPRTRAQYRRSIRVEAVAALFGAVVDKTRGAIEKIGVDFELGDSLVLKPDKLADEAKVFVPLADYILGRENEGTYRYQVTAAYASGIVHSSAWLTAHNELLFIDLDVLAGSS